MSCCICYQAHENTYSCQTCKDGIICKECLKHMINERSININDFNNFDEFVTDVSTIKCPICILKITIDKNTIYDICKNLIVIASDNFQDEQKCLELIDHYSKDGFLKLTENDYYYIVKNNLQNARKEFLKHCSKMVVFDAYKHLLIKKLNLIRKVKKYKGILNDIKYDCNNIERILLSDFIQLMNYEDQLHVTLV